MYTRAFLSVALVGLSAVCTPASAGTYTVDCGSNGPASLVQNQLAAITGKNNTLTVAGTCTGDLQLIGLDSLTISGLSMTGTLIMSAATHISLQGLTINGGLLATDHASLTVSNSTVNGYVQLMHESSGSFSNMTIRQWTDPTTGAGGSGILCEMSSECQFSNTTVSGIPSGSVTTPSIGVQVVSASRFNFASGRISGFDWGVHVWNNATAFFNPDCADLSIDSNKSIGVYVRDGGVVKLEGAPSADTTSTCPANVVIGNNGDYGMLAEGGGLGFLYRAQITGHAVDGVRIQDGSVVKVRSSTIDRATSTGRSAAVKSHAHLWFNEETAGPAAGSTLAGAVCVTNDSSVDTDNSSTTVRAIPRCPSP
jgi:hypothetical protein